MTESNTTYGKIGVKVWIFKGEVYEKKNLSPSSKLSFEKKNNKKNIFKNKRNIKKE
jgi:small subunit ribosomal protein S3